MAYFWDDGSEALAYAGDGGDAGGGRKVLGQGSKRRATQSVDGFRM